MQAMLAHWILIFFAYCFIGWVWECFYVSIRIKEWVNRGFLHGPFLPLYGFGALIILWFTLPFRHDIALVFLFGMLGATILEYFTGIMMEYIFHIRYWDYSYRRFNYKGYISLFTSLGWGFFSTLLVEFIHPFVSSLILTIPYNMAELISLFLTANFAVDVTKSVQNAYDMKEFMRKLTENMERFESLRSRLDSIVSEINSQMSLAKSERKIHRLSILLTEFSRLREGLKKAEFDLNTKKDKEFRKAANLVRKYPTAVSQRFKKALEEIKSIYNSNKKLK